MVSFVTQRVYNQIKIAADLNDKFQDVNTFVKDDNEPVFKLI
jgi:hypothetical protein